MITPDLIVVLARMAQELCAILLWGSLAYLAFLVPQALSLRVFLSLRPWLKGAGVLLAFATLALLPLEAASLGDAWAEAINPATLHDVLAINIGFAWIVQSILALALLVAMLMLPQHMKLLACLAGLLLASRTLLGHAVMLEGSGGALLHANYIAHILAAGAWVGALLPLFIILQTMVVEATQDQALALQRFSVAGHAAVAIAIGSGILNVWMIHGQIFPANPTSYDTLLALKLALVAVMVSMALVNRYGLLYRTGSSSNAAQWLRRITMAEFSFGLVVLILANLLGSSNPH